MSLLTKVIANASESALERAICFRGPARVRPLWLAIQRQRARLVVRAMRRAGRDIRTMDVGRD